MAFEAPGASEFSFEAGADLTDSQFHWVALTTSGQVIEAPDDASAIGILQNKPSLGEAATVWMAGISKLCAGAAPINIGDLVGSGAEGEGVSGGGLGRALSPTTGADQLTTVVYDCRTPLAGAAPLQQPPSGNDQYDAEQEFVEPTSPTRDTGLDTARPNRGITQKAVRNAEKDKERNEKENRVKAGNLNEDEEPAGLHGER